MLKRQKRRQNSLKIKNIKNFKIAIVVAMYNRQLTKKLEKSCIDTVMSEDVSKDQIDVYYVPGAFEIPLKCQQLAQLKKYHAIIALGVILKGDTYHFELVASECARGVMAVMLKYNIPIIFEVLACYNRQDAFKRCRDDDYNKGVEAAKTAIDIINHNAR